MLNFKLTVHSTTTFESHLDSYLPLHLQARPSLKQKRPKNQRRSIPLSPMAQHCINTDGLMLQCEECDMWRLVFAKYKITKKQRSQLLDVLKDVAYTCGVMLGKCFFTHYYLKCITLCSLYTNISINSSLLCRLTRLQKKRSDIHFL